MNIVYRRKIKNIKKKKKVKNLKFIEHLVCELFLFLITEAAVKKY